MEVKIVVGWQFDFCGGHLAVDFANSVSDRLTKPIDHITTYADLVAFARQADIVTPRVAVELQRTAEQHPDEAQAVLREVVAIRETLYGLFSAIALAQPPRAEDLEVLNSLLSRLRVDERFEWQWHAGPWGLDAPLGPIVRAALDLLTNGPRDRVRMCEAETCAWLFLDTSKNRSRRWCAMAQCGNRAKARRHYERHRAKA
jgi:predicted RNA-binding Zn ribbon-like protein